MRFRGWIMASSAVVALGCASSTPITDHANQAYTASEQPYRAALFISPELAATTAEVTTPSGERVVLPIGDMIDAELRRGTSRAFDGFVVIPDAAYTGPRSVEAIDARELWPKTKHREETPPDVIVACFPAEMRGHVLPGGDCERCWGTISYRAGIRYEVRSLDGEVLSTGVAEGVGVERTQGGEPLPLSTRLRDAVSQAVTSLALQYRVSLKNADIVLPSRPGLDEDPHLAERERARDAG